MIEILKREGSKFTPLANTTRAENFSFVGLSDSETQQMLLDVGFRSSTQPTCFGIYVSALVVLRHLLQVANPNASSPLSG
ncbi:hypothetical protein F7734_22210 [Scytonema sp. UIC 10036]|uniref:hypothetical protein n=1 Tax=Scytonema sp. UIC 10036 TaxID=2304196 RepID=UPI0012DA5E29|nr:hypothetical protein [Scytonema sp. UIC 10036]MUG94931.1 hypothetical protein [Scytonema sp. UIC 10036]